MVKWFFSRQFSEKMTQFKNLVKRKKRHNPF